MSRSWIFALVPLALAAPSSIHLSCGVLGTASCANTTSAKEPCKVVDIDGTPQHKCSVVEYSTWLTVGTWGQCQEACKKAEGCMSFDYIFLGPSLYEQSAMQCNLYFKPISDYLISCNGSGAALLDTFYDVGCPAPAKNTTGHVPAHPNTRITNGTCNGALEWNTIQSQWAGDAYHAAPINLTQAECSAECKKQTECKSYFWANMQGGSVMKKGHYQSTSYPKPDKQGYDPAQCFLLSQPVSGYTTSEVVSAANSFFDRNCPIEKHSPNN